MSVTAATRRSYDAVAAEYDVAIGDELEGKPLDRALLDVVVEHAAGGPVVDAGCGPGHVAQWLATRGATTCGVDLSPAMAARAVARGVPAAAGDLTALPFLTGSCAAVVCFYAVIHLPASGRDAAYREFARVLRPDGVALVAFHVRTDGVTAGETVATREFFGHEVDLEFRYLDPTAESGRLAAAGLAPVARVDRAPVPGVEHASDRSYLLVRRPPSAGDPRE